MASDERPDVGRSKRETFQLAGAGFLALVLVVFVLLNTDKTEIDFLVTSVEMPLVLVLLGTALLGAVIAELVRFQRRRSRT